LPVKLTKISSFFRISFLICGFPTHFLIKITHMNTEKDD